MPLVVPDAPYELLTVADLPSTLTPPSGLTVEQMVADAVALATLTAPCLGTTPTELTTAQQAAAKAVLRQAVLRWAEAGAGALTTVAVDDYSQTTDTRQPRRGLFWPSEIESLQSICRGVDDGKAFTVDTVAATVITHAETCSLIFGAEYCSCGAWLSLGLPLYEDPVW